jgi:hypothetical protein
MRPARHVTTGYNNRHDGPRTNEALASLGVLAVFLAVVF